MRRLGLLLSFCLACSASPPISPSTSEPSIDLELVDATLNDALVAIATRASVNIFVDPGLDEVSVTLRVHARPWREVLANLALEHRLRIEKLAVRGADHEGLWISRESGPPAPVTSFTGERITARFDEAPIREVAKTIGSFAKTNIVVDDGVQAAITLHLRLPWDLALYHLAQKYGLRIVRGEHEIRIAAPASHD